MVNSFSNPIYLIAAIFAMAGVTLLTRLTPMILPKKILDAPLLLAVNKALPLSVMTLLILSSLHWKNDSDAITITPLLMAQILALMVVLLSYHWKKYLLLSMIIGIASINLFLGVFALVGYQ